MLLLWMRERCAARRKSTTGADTTHATDVLVHHVLSKPAPCQPQGSQRCQASRVSFTITGSFPDLHKTGVLQQGFFGDGKVSELGGVWGLSNGSSR
jgi:hypothetical protein